MRGGKKMDLACMIISGIALIFGIVILIKKKRK